MKTSLVIIFGSLLSLSPFKSADALTAVFTQSGFLGGGVVEGSFSGNDANQDNILEAEELDSWVAEYISGPTDLTDSFLLSSLGEDGSLISFNFNISNHLLDDFFVQAHNFRPMPSLELTSLITTVMDDEGDANTSTGEVVVTKVPEPSSTLSMVIVGSTFLVLRFRSLKTKTAIPRISHKLNEKTILTSQNCLF